MTTNQCPDERFSKKVNLTLANIIISSKDQLKHHQNSIKKYRMNLGINRHFFCNTEAMVLKTLTSKFEKLCDLQVVFITRILRSCLFTLKSSFDRDVESDVVNEIKCNTRIGVNWADKPACFCQDILTSKEGFTAGSVFW